MRKIVDGVAYDTETAARVGGWDNGCYPDDFGYQSEDLYRKSNGEYFLYFEGGARSRYFQGLPRRYLRERGHRGARRGPGERVGSGTPQR